MIEPDPNSYTQVCPQLFRYIRGREGRPVAQISLKRFGQQAEKTWRQATVRAPPRKGKLKETAELKVLLEIASQLKKIRALLKKILEKRG